MAKKQTKTPWEAPKPLKALRWEHQSFLRPQGDSIVQESLRTQSDGRDFSEDTRMKSEAGPGPGFPPLGNYRLKRSVGLTEALAPVITGDKQACVHFGQCREEFEGSFGERRPP